MKANLRRLFIFFVLPFAANSQLQDLYPTRSVGFYCSCSGDGQQPYPSRYRKFSHFLKDPSTQERIIIGNSCLYIEDLGLSNVAADGGVSYYEIFYYCEGEGDPFSNLDDPNFNLNDFYDEYGNLLPSDVEANGRFSIEQRGSGGNHLILKYEHPKLPPTSKTKVINAFLGFIGFKITIYHPPVVMIHGLWADRSSFDAMEANLMGMGLYEPWQLYKADYKSTNARSFSTNLAVPQTAIEQALGQCRFEYIAVEKANIVCHSMGGLLTRKFVQGPFYSQYKSVNKIITCNTPHQGSQMANWLLDYTSYGGSAAATVLNSVGYYTMSGAVNDLRVGSSAIVSIQNGAPQDPVKVHSISSVQSHSVGPPSLSWYFAAPLTSMLFQIAALCGNNYVSDIFDSPDSDLVVALESQVGGLTGLNTQLYNDQVHVGSVANAQVMAAVSEKLGINADDPSFANQFNAQTLNYSIGSNCILSNDLPIREAKIATVNLEITAPTAAQNVNAGSNLTISFNSSIEVDSVMAFLPHTHQKFAIQKIKHTNNTFTLPTDIALLGPVKLVLAGYSATNQLLTTASVVYNQTTIATINSIYAYPSSVYLHQNDSLAVNIFGKFSDNIDRDITHDPNLSFDFLQNNAMKLGANIILNNAVNDTLTVSYNIPTARQAANPIQLVINTLDQIQVPLPVRLLSFTGKATGKSNLLQWKTNNEINFSHFEVEKSNDGLEFEKIGIVYGIKSENYEFLDQKPKTISQKLNYYRLKMIDLDGKSSYSKIIFIQNYEKSEISAFPNPFSDKISVENNEGKALKISLIDITGKEMIKPVISTQNRIELNTQKVETGIYFLQIKEGEKVKIEKLIKQ